MITYDKYKVQTSEPFLTYEFLSEGPKGTIAKQVRFEMLTGFENVFNLGFGDLEPDGEVNDVVVSDNKDGEKVLATIATSILMFFEAHPESIIYIEGRTAARARLFQMRIARHLDEVRAEFHVIGLKNGVWHTFERGLNFEALLIERRK